MLVRIIRDLGLGLAAGLASLVLLEVTLSLFGIAQPIEEEELSRGFDHSAAYFTPVEDQPGTWQTQFWAADEGRPVVIPPKDGRKRVLMFGGSNTEGFGLRFINEALRDADQLENFEVINLGRHGYGSERVSIIFDQALENLAPDIVVIYTGHNEFVEAGFQKDLEVKWPSESTRLAAKAAQGLHTFQALRDAVMPAPQLSTPMHSSAPTDWQWEYDKFKDTTYPETLQRFAAYQANLERMVEASEARGVGVVLCTVIYNRFSIPYLSTPPPELGAQARDTVAALMAEARDLLPAALEPLFPREDSGRLLNTDWEANTREALASGTKRAATREELHGWRDFEGVLADTDPLLPPPAFWNPKVEALLSSLDVLNARAPSPDQRQTADHILSLIEELLAIEPDHARALFMRGILRDWTGADPALVRADLEDAGAFDRAPLRGTRLTNSIVEEVAKAHPDVLFFDADRLWCDRHPMQLVGWEWMLDRCHLSLGARRLLMFDLATLILDRWEPAQ